MFEPLRIVGIDESKTVPFGDGSAMFNVYLRLSALPDSAWTEAFQTRRRFPRHSGWRKAYLTGGHICLECPLEEVEPVHKKDLLEDVAYANERASESHAAREAENQKRRAAEAEQRERVHQLAKNIKF